MKVKQKVIILFVICLLILVGAVIADKIMGKTYLNEITYSSLTNKIENKEDVIVLISQTTCGHCANYKPKLEFVAKKYKINIYYIDVDLLSKEENNKLEEHIKFDSTPITVFLKNGEESSVATRINGDASIEKIERKLKSNGFIK